MSKISDSEGIAYRVMYGIILVACFVIDISAFSEIDLTTIHGLEVLNVVKTIIFGLIGVFSHIFFISLSSLDAVTAFGMLVMIIWLVILLFTFVIDKDKEQDVWRLLPLWLMPISGLTLIFYGLKPKVKKNERE